MRVRNLKKSIMLTFCFTLLFGLIAPFTTSNMLPVSAETIQVEVPNGSFEEVDNPRWSLVTNNPSTSISFSEEKARTGNRSLHFKDENSNNPGGNLQVTSEKISVTKGVSYIAKAYVNVVSQSHSIGYEVHFFNGEGQKVGSATFINFNAATLGKDKWTEIQVPFEVPEGATQVELRFNSGHPSITEAYFDDVTIEGTTIEEPPVDDIHTEVMNPSFEEAVVDGSIPG